MSTYYYSNQPINPSEVVKIIDKVKDFKIEIERKDVPNKTDKWETITSSSVLEKESVYRISYTSKPSLYEIHYFKKDEDKETTNYLFMFVDKNLKVDFSRYGKNYVERIIDIIEYQTSIRLFDEHTY